MKEEQWKRVWVLRHGESCGNAGEEAGHDPVLTPKGIEQARAVGKFLRRMDFQKIFVSPLKRTRQTLEYAGFDTGRACLDSRIVEHRFPGVYQSSILPYEKPAGYASPDLHDAWEKPFADRIHHFLSDLATSPDERILVVSHGGASVGMANDILRSGNMESLGIENKMRGMQNCAIALFHLHPDPRKSQIAFWNYMAHLPSEFMDEEITPVP